MSGIERFAAGRYEVHTDLKRFAPILRVLGHVCARTQVSMGPSTPMSVVAGAYVDDEDGIKALLLPCWAQAFLLRASRSVVSLGWIEVRVSAGKLLYSRVALEPIARLVCAVARVSCVVCRVSCGQTPTSVHTHERKGSPRHDGGCR